MKNFFKIASGVAVNQLALELHQNPGLWNVNPARLTEGNPFADTDDIWVRYNDENASVACGSHADIVKPHDSIWYPAFYALPAARAIIFDLARRVEAERIGGVLIWRVPPGKSIKPHEDHGWHPEYYDKFNVCLQSKPGCAFTYADEAIQDQPGDVHRFKNDVTHAVINHSDDDYIVMCVCLKTHDYSKRFQPTAKAPS